MADKVNPKDFPDATGLSSADLIPVHQPTGWCRVTFSSIKAWLALSFAEVGDGASAVAAHLMELDPHTQYIQEAPQDGKIYVRRNGTWEVLEIS